MAIFFILTVFWAKCISQHKFGDTVGRKVCITMFIFFLALNLLFTREIDRKLGAVKLRPDKLDIHSFGGQTRLEADCPVVQLDLGSRFGGPLEEVIAIVLRPSTSGKLDAGRYD